MYLSPSMTRGKLTFWVSPNGGRAYRIRANSFQPLNFLRGGDTARSTTNMLIHASLAAGSKTWCPRWRTLFKHQLGHQGQKPCPQATMAHHALVVHDIALARHVQIVLLK